LMAISRRTEDAGCWLRRTLLSRTISELPHHGGWGWFYAERAYVIVSHPLSPLGGRCWLKFWPVVTPICAFRTVVFPLIQSYVLH
jgi:hypothetical protein